MSNDPDTLNGRAAAPITKQTSSCQHLIRLLANTGSQIEDLLLKTRSRHHVASKEDGGSHSLSRFSKGLGTTYACLQCLETGSLAQIASHSKQEKHRISLDTRSGALYCAPCKDLYYHRSVEFFNLFGNPNVDETKKRKFSEALESDPFILNNSSLTPCSRDGARGLFNLGQTCYMNSVIQSLLHDPLLISYFLGEQHSSRRCEVEDCLACAVTETFAECRATDRQDGYAALSLLLASWKQLPSLAGYAQQDAHEYYQALVDKLHESAMANREAEEPCKCFFHKAFFGTLRSTITCNVCSQQRKTDDPINDLSLHMEIQQAAKKKEKISNGTADGHKSAPTLESCLESYMAKEKLVATCKTCGNASRPATKQLKLRRLPAILCMQMKRFDNSSQSESTKIEGKVDFPLSLDMSPYTTNHKATTVSNTNGTSTKSGTTHSFPASRVDSERLIYDLTSVIVHKGSLDSGHYYAYCRETSPNHDPSKSFPAATTTDDPTAATTTEEAPSPPPPPPPQEADSTTTSPPSPSTIPSHLFPPPKSDRWYLFNDDRVTLASAAEVLSADAYLLFYGLRWLPPPDPSRPILAPVVRHPVDEESDSD